VDYDLTLDPSITLDELQRARDEPADKFPDVDAQDSPGTMATLFSAPRTPKEALAVAKQYTDNNTFVGVGMCLRTVHEYFNVGALWPDAETAYEHSAPRHHQTDPLGIPRGAVIYWSNGRHGHVALSCGGGFCRTTDYRRNGFVDLAPIANLASWCGGQLDGWGEVLNGVDVWPTPPAKDKPAKPTPAPWGLADKEAMLAQALAHAKHNHAPQRRINGLTAWHDHVAARLADAKKK
jgi:hypothetical protein